MTIGSESVGVRLATVREVLGIWVSLCDGDDCRQATGKLSIIWLGKVCRKTRSHYSQLTLSIALAILFPKRLRYAT
jgi:hypothetical protein